MADVKFTDEYYGAPTGPKFVESNPLPEAASGGGPDLIGQLKESASGLAGEYGPTVYGFNPAQAAIDFAAPGSWPELAAQVAATALAGPAGGFVSKGLMRVLPGLSKVAPTVARGAEILASKALSPAVASKVGGLAGAGARTGIVGGAGAAGAALSGEDIEHGLKTGIYSQLFGEGVAALSAPAVAYVYKKFGHLNTMEFKRAVRQYFAPKLAANISKDIPSLAAEAPIKNAYDIGQIVEPQHGRIPLARTFDRLEGTKNIKGEIPTALGDTTVTIPRKAYETIGETLPGGETAPKQGLYLPGGQRMTFGDIAKMNPSYLKALQSAGEAPASATSEFVDVPGKEAARIVKRIRNIAYSKKPTVENYFQYREAANESMDALMSTINRVDPALGKRYRQLKDDWSKFMDLRDMLEGNIPYLLPPMKDGPNTVDVRNFYTAMLSMNHQVDRARFPNLWNGFEGPELAGVPAPITVPSPRTVMNIPGGSRVAANVPAPKLLQPLPPQVERLIATQERAQALATRRRGKIVPLSIPTVSQLTESGE